MQSPNICRVDRNVAPRAGGRAWHFSYLGGPERIAEKLLSFAHAEYSTPNWTDTARIQRAMDARIDLFDRGGTFAVVPVDESFPEPLQKEPERWKEYLCDLL
jgi:beta-1,4-mannosyl-glycoprotein beta-1,4-N-acetylglucosaminyltransferase